MAVIYIPIPVTERLPPEKLDNFYFVIDKSGARYMTMFSGHFPAGVEFWLEETELPDEQAIWIAGINHQQEVDGSLTSFMAGAKYILKLLKR